MKPKKDLRLKSATNTKIMKTACDIKMCIFVLMLILRKIKENCWKLSFIEKFYCTELYMQHHHLYITWNCIEKKNKASLKTITKSKDQFRFSNECAAPLSQLLSQLILLRKKNHQHAREKIELKSLFCFYIWSSAISSEGR